MHNIVRSDRSYINSRIQPTINKHKRFFYDITIFTWQQFEFSNWTSNRQAVLWTLSYSKVNIYNNNNGVDINNHTRAWDAMQARIKTYGNKLKDLRIKYDYYPQNFSNSEIEQDLKFIKDNKSEFDYMITELKNSISSFNTTSNFLTTANKEIQDIENEYNSLIKIIEKRLPRK